MNTTLPRLSGVLIAAALLAACGTPPPPPRLVHLASAPPPGASAPAAPASRARWQLVLPVRVPEYLDRDALLVPQGQAGLAPLAPWRWAEPLADSVSRVLRADLARQLGEGALWTSPLPAGVAVQRQLRVELLGFEASADRREVRLEARWSLVDPTGAAAPMARSAQIRSEVPGTADGDAIAAAHRMALWRLAERIVAGTPP
ncbi:MAG: membrane integrity-associated transporter subunit PqiC [Rubrivivax sp.]|nr:membrane integrity-associated transporter subunit PqiC [Rubrivivax sp.]